MSSSNRIGKGESLLLPLFQGLRPGKTVYAKILLEDYKEFLGAYGWLIKHASWNSILPPVGANGKDDPWQREEMHVILDQEGRPLTVIDKDPHNTAGRRQLAAVKYGLESFVGKYSRSDDAEYTRDVFFGLRREDPLPENFGEIDGNSVSTCKVMYAKRFVYRTGTSSFVFRLVHLRTGKTMTEAQASKRDAYVLNIETHDSEMARQDPGYASLSLKQKTIDVMKYLEMSWCNKLPISRVGTLGRVCEPRDGRATSKNST